MTQLKILLPATFLCAVSFSALGQANSLVENIAAFDAKDCQPVVDQEIDRLNIDRSKISQLQYVTNDIDRRKFVGVSNYQAWLSFNNCKGNYVINMNKACQIETTWGTDECKLEDIQK